MKKNQIITRIAPSPSGNLHIGTARSALFNYLFARQNNGKFIIRIEDTDKQRSKKEFEDDILEGLKWLGLDNDNLYRQSERTDVYKKYIEKLLKNGKAYLSKEESKIETGKQVEVVRLKNPNRKVEFDDIIRGKIEFDTTELGDFVIAKTINDPLYHLAVVVDDYEMEISHIIRGEDHISNTPRQILIQEALEIDRPKYAHIPLILAPNRSKMSKRGNATSISEYRQKGYISDALINYIALLGWNPGTNNELFAMNKLVEEFNLENIQKGGAIFDIEKLNWFNREYIKKMSEEEIFKNIKQNLPENILNMSEYNDKILKKIIPIIKERINIWSDILKITKEGDLDYYFKQPKYETKNLLWKTDTDLNIVAKNLLKIINFLENISDNKFNSDEIKKSIWDFAEKEGRGSVLWPMRYALSGKDKSPDPFKLTEALEKKETISRLHNAINKIA
ncbi:glutamate--tRNA ligase [Candidatus Campbellbacteria bacterium CG10_big_fil_rev_8_21_14_0_10_35_52]|uniref:Glutamate--tRNA ligase n=1 Tax=Candidatus Campbellbacteria bacterium CG10_big_fil_rev_8_21_14_0_10_35_52 TaxID=1974527 RepID=A0A2M6WVE7_9BACT|nr:MAG: glutamate--tRNA ligase [Candidatus Campbellbacteria bacterium CG10_big_fil_rev_8_21_14_0_10_35_52]